MRLSLTVGIDLGQLLTGAISLLYRQFPVPPWTLLPEASHHDAQLSIVTRCEAHLASLSRGGHWKLTVRWVWQ